MLPADAGALSSLFMPFVWIPTRLPEVQVVQPHQPRLIVTVQQTVGSAFQAKVTGVVKRAVGHGFAPFHLKFPDPHSSGLGLVKMAFTHLAQCSKPSPRVPTKGGIWI